MPPLVAPTPSGCRRTKRSAWAISRSLCPSPIAEACASAVSSRRTQHRARHGAPRWLARRRDRPRSTGACSPSRYGADERPDASCQSASCGGCLDPSSSVVACRHRPFRLRLHPATGQRRGVDEPGDGAPGMKHVERQQHWDTVCGPRVRRDLSWFEAVPEISLATHAGCGWAVDGQLRPGRGRWRIAPDRPSRRSRREVPGCARHLGNGVAALPQSIGRTRVSPDTDRGRRHRRLVAEADGHLARSGGVPPDSASRSGSLPRTPAGHAEAGRECDNRHVRPGRAGEVQRPSRPALLAPYWRWSWASGSPRRKRVAHAHDALGNAQSFQYSRLERLP